MASSHSGPQTSALKQYIPMPLMFCCPRPIHGQMKGPWCCNINVVENSNPPIGKAISNEQYTLPHFTMHDYICCCSLMLTFIIFIKSRVHSFHAHSTQCVLSRCRVNPNTAPFRDIVTLFDAFSLLMQYKQFPHNQPFLSSQNNRIQSCELFS